jgi:hypothetical protein
VHDSVKVGIAVVKDGHPSRDGVVSDSTTRRLGAVRITRAGPRTVIRGLAYHNSAALPAGESYLALNGLAAFPSA